MKKMLVLAAVALATTPAFASKARLSALQSAAHLSDTRDVLAKPDRAMAHGEFATLEVGDGTGTNPKPEGGFTRKMGDNSAMGAYLGNKSGLGIDSLGLVTAVYSVQNPLNLYYASKMGDLSWGLGLQYAASEDKAAKKKSSLMGLTASATSVAGWDAQFSFGLTGEATNTAGASEVKATQGSPMSISGGYAMDSLYVYAKYAMLGAKHSTGGTASANVEKTDMTVGVVNSHKKDGADFYYGVSYTSSVNKDKEGTQSKTESSKLPVIVGIEAEAASWLVVRGSITQSVLMSASKTSTTAGTTNETSMTDDTVVAGGLGLKLSKFTVDGTLAGSSTGKLGSDDHFMANLGLTYKF